MEHVRSKTPRRTRWTARTGRGISQEIILDAALELIERHGLERFSIRELANYLHVYPATLYWHLDGGRDSLLAAVLARALSDAAPELSDSDPWHDWLRRLFFQYREAVRRRPNIAPLIGSQLVTDAGLKPLITERVLTVLQRAGFSGKALVNAYNAVVAAMVGYVTLELAMEPKDRAANHATKFRRQLEQLPRDAFPMVAQNLDLLFNQAYMLRWQNGVKAPLTGGFETFVEAFVLGMQALSRRNRQSTGRS